MTIQRMEIIGDCTLYLGDCLEIMPTLSIVDHVISDPPYEQESHDSLGKKRRNDGIKPQESLTFAGIDLIRDKVCEATFLLKPKWRLFFCTVEGCYLWKRSMVASGGKYKSSPIWYKPDSMPKFNGQGPAVAFECMALDWCASGHSYWNAGGKRNVYKHNTNQPDREGTHPTEKPIPLMKELISDFTNFGDLILDPFMGSGTTGVACVKLGRKFIGIEKDQKYFDVSCRRIEQAKKQPDLFIQIAKAEQVGMDL